MTFNDTKLWDFFLIYIMRKILIFFEAVPLPFLLHYIPSPCKRLIHDEVTSTERFISYRKYILQITQPSQYRCAQLQYRFAVISEALSK